MQITNISSYGNYYNKNQTNPSFGKTIKLKIKIPEKIKKINPIIKIPNVIKIPDSIKSVESFKNYLINNDPIGLICIIANNAESSNKNIPEHIKVLKKNKININNINELRTFKDKKLTCNMTELQWQCHQGNKEIVSALLKLDNIDVNIKDENGKTALMYAANGFNNTNIIQDFMKRKDLDINAQDNGGWSALMYSTLRGNTESVKLLLENEKIDINAKTEKGITAQYIADLYGFFDILKLINSKSI